MSITRDPLTSNQGKVRTWVASSGLVDPAWRTGREDKRRLALIGMLLIMPWVLLTLMPGYRPPFAASLATNHVRFVILFMATAFHGAGFLLLIPYLLGVCTLFRAAEPHKSDSLEVNPDRAA